jgi:hypothetical protein
MNHDEAIALVLQLNCRGVELKQRRRLLVIEKGENQVGAELRWLIARNWNVVAQAVAAHRVAQRAVENRRLASIAGVARMIGGERALRTS